MRIAWKLTAAWAVGLALALGGVTWTSLQALRDLHTNEVRDDLALFAVTTRDAAAYIGLHEGAAAVERYVADVDADERRTRVELLRSEPSAETLARNNEVVRESRALTVNGETWWLLTERRLDREEARFNNTVTWQVGMALFIFLCATVISLGLGVIVVGRRVERLAALSRAVADGHMVRGDEDPAHDELAALSRAMNEMIDRLATAREEVEAEHRARARAFEQLRHADRLSSVGKLASGFAHELGTPLNVVAGHARRIARHKEAPPEVRELAEKVAEQTRRMTDQIRTVLDYSRRKEVTRASHSLRALLEEAIALVAPIADDVEISVDAFPDVDADVDAGRLLQVLTNLLMNAVQAMPDGGWVRLGADVVVVDDPPDPRALPGRYLAIHVADNGPGIEREALGHIFEPFFTTKGRGKGTGLGLSICHAIIREHDGFIAVTSEPGAGTTFHIHLPVPAADAS